MSQTTSFLPFEDDFFSGGSGVSGSSQAAAAAAFGSKPAAGGRSAPVQPASSHGSGSQSKSSKPAPLPLNVVDPFDEPVFPVPQTPPKMKPRPSTNAGQGGAAAAAQQPAAQTQPQASPGTMKKRCVYAACTNDRFARGYCALHLSEIAAKGASNDPAPTPVSRIRNVHNLWQKSIQIDKETFQNDCMWRIVSGDDEHTIELRDNTFLGLRTVTINNKEVFRGQPEMGAWKLDATIGQSFKNSVNVKVVVVPNVKGYEYECLIDELRFDDAHQAFLTKLSGASVMQRYELGEKTGHTKDVREAQLRDALYVKQNWSTATEEEKTAMTGTKSKITWNFSVRGRKHVIVLEYGSLSGKKKILLNGEVMVEKKPSVLSANKHKRWGHKFVVDGVPCSITTQKNKFDTAGTRPFLFNFFLDGVVFEDCCLTETDLAGGDVSLDQMARKLAQTGLKSTGGVSSSSSSSSRAIPAGVSGGRRNSVHKPLSAEEYEQQMADEAARARQIDAKAREEREKKRQAKAAQKKKAGGKLESSSEEDSSSESDDE